MVKIYMGLLIVLIAFVVLCEGQIQTRCPPEDTRDLVYGQSFYTVTDSSGGNPNMALRNLTRHKIHPEYLASHEAHNVSFTILVPNIFHGVEMRKMTVLTRNVVQVVVIVTKESQIEPKENGDLQVFGGGVGELVDDIRPLNKFQRTSFEFLGDIARVEVNFYRGNKGRIRVQKLYISACKGQIDN